MAGQVRRANLADQLESVNGSPQYLGTVVATTTKNNSTTATPFAIPPGAYLLLQSDAAVYVAPGTSASAAVTAGNGVLLGANEKFTLILGLESPAEAYVACLAVSGTANVKVFQLR